MKSVNGVGRENICEGSKIQNSKFLKIEDMYVILFDKKARTFVQKYSGY